MPLWIIIVVFGQFLNAIVALADKHIVASKKVSKPIVYAFFVGLLSVLSVFIFVFGFLPFDFGDLSLPSLANVSSPNLFLMVLAVLSSAAFFMALYNIYSALTRADASDVVPVVSSASAIFTFAISYLFLNESLSHNFFYGFLLLVIGMAILSHFRFKLKTLIQTLLAGFFFAVYFVCMKALFNNFHFDQTFFWTRIGMLVVVLFLILWPYSYKKIFSEKRKIKKKIEGGVWVVGNSLLGGLASLALLKATELGSVTMVQALGGLQFAFLTVISVLFGRITPMSLGEKNNWFDVVQKILSVTLIISGFYLLFI